MPLQTPTPPLSPDIDPVRELDAQWGKVPFSHERFWIDISTLKLAVPDLDTMLRKMPPERVFVRAAGEGADAGVIPRLPFDERPLADQLAARNLHVVALDLQNHDPTFAEALDRFVALVRPLYEKRGHTLVSPTIGIFLASGRSIVPFHTDLEHNFLMHIYGEKWLHVFPNTDWEILPAKSRERMCVDSGAGRFLEYKPDFEARGKVIRFGPGVSGYQPPYCPHWVENGPNVTLSLLLSVYTSNEVNIRLNHVCNHGLRRFGVNPAKVGEHPGRDAVKVKAAYCMRAGVRMLRRLRGQKTAD